MIRRFLEWWETKLLISSGLVPLILILQIPHFLWGGDVLAGTGTVYTGNQLSDFILYGIDLIEIPLILLALLNFSAYMHKRIKKKERKQQ